MNSSVKKVRINKTTGTVLKRQNTEHFLNGCCLVEYNVEKLKLPNLGENQTRHACKTLTYIIFRKSGL